MTLLPPPLQPEEPVTPTSQPLPRASGDWLMGLGLGLFCSLLWIGLLEWLYTGLGRGTLGLVLASGIYLALPIVLIVVGFRRSSRAASQGSGTPPS